MTMSQCTMKDLRDKLGKLGPDELILDVRSADEFKAGHIPGSRNIPHDQVLAQAAELKNYKCVYIHCQAGRRAGLAAEALASQGLTNIVCISSSGMGEWIALGYPLEK